MGTLQALDKLRMRYAQYAVLYSTFKVEIILYPKCGYISLLTCTLLKLVVTKHEYVARIKLEK